MFDRARLRLIWVFSLKNSSLLFQHCCIASPIMRTPTQHFALSEKNTVVTMMILIQLYFVMIETKFLIFLYCKLNVWYCKTFMACQLILINLKVISTVPMNAILKWIHLLQQWSFSNVRFLISWKIEKISVT